MPAYGALNAEPTLADVNQIFNYLDLRYGLPDKDKKLLRKNKGEKMIRLIIGFVTGYTFAKITGHTEFEKKIKNIFHKCKDAVKEEFGKEEATETS